MARFVPIPDPGGSLEPPRRNPPTTLATDSPDPVPDPRSAILAELYYRQAMLRCTALLRRLADLRSGQPLHRLAEGVALAVARVGHASLRALRLSR